MNKTLCIVAGIGALMAPYMEGDQVVVMRKVDTYALINPAREELRALEYRITAPSVFGENEIDYLGLVVMSSASSASSQV